uniref:Uncharacterized protein n=1 Tax=Arundo donax TaxID=35708 RepID=A0A0A9HGF5_ARUDO
MLGAAQGSDAAGAQQRPCSARSLERLCFQRRRANLGRVQPLHNHHEPAVKHRLVRRPHAPAAEHLCRSAHQLLEAVTRRLARAEC